MLEMVDTVVMIYGCGWRVSYRCGTGRLVHILELDCEDIAPVVLVEQLLRCDLWLVRDMGQDEVGVPGFVLEFVRCKENAITDNVMGDTVAFKLTGAPIPHVAFDSEPVVEGWEQFGFTCRFYQQLGAQGRGTGSSITANEELVTLTGDVDNLRRKQDLLDSFEGIREMFVPDNCFLA